MKLREAGKQNIFVELLNASNPSISVYILHTVLHTLPKVLTKTIRLTVKSFFSW